MLLQKLLATAQQVWPFYTGLHSSRFTIQLSLPQPQLLPPAACSAAWCVSVRALETNCRNSATAKMQGAYHVWSETAQLQPRGVVHIALKHRQNKQRRVSIVT
jgi:hypothetical protein